MSLLLYLDFALICLEEADIEREASGSFCWFDINIEVLAEIGDNGNRRGL